MISGFLADRDLQFKASYASSPLHTYLVKRAQGIHFGAICSVLQYVVVYGSVMQFVLQIYISWDMHCWHLSLVQFLLCGSVLRYVAGCCSVLQYVADIGNVL